MRFLSSTFGLFASAVRLETVRGGVLPPISSRDRLKARSRYLPHQGKRECARRLRQWAKIEARRGKA